MRDELVISKIFNNTVSVFPDKVALEIKKDERWLRFTYKDLEVFSLKVAAFLLKEGFKKGEYAALVLENRPEWGIIYLGIMHAGLGCVPIDPQLSEDEIKNLILDSRAKIVFSSYSLFVAKIKQALGDSLVKSVILDITEDEEKNLYKFSDIENISLENITLPTVLTEDIASLIYTSGTTGKPKGVMLTHKNICANFMSIQKTNLCLSSDNFLSNLPLYHSYAFIVTLIVPLFLGAKVTYALSFKGEELTQIIDEASVTILVGVPQLFSLLHKAIFDRIKKIPSCLRPLLLPFIKLKLRRQFASLRLSVSGGARLEPKIGRDLLRLGLRVIEGYGLTEASPVVTLNPPQRIKFGSVGKALPGVQIKILNPDKNRVGQVLIKGDNIMQGYFKRPDLTNQVIKDGWFYSGDLGYIDKEGYLFLVGREEEMIVLASGKNIYPQELEEYYSQSPYIKELCIMLKKEQLFGYPKDLPYAVIVPDLEYFAKKKETNIREKIRWDLDSLGRKLVAYKHIMGFALTKEALPRTVLKKIKRFAVRQKYLLQKPLEAESEETVLTDEDKKILEKEISQKVIQYVSKEVNKPVNLDNHLEIDLGIDSLTRVELGLGLEAIFKINIPDELLYKVSTIRDVIINLEDLMKSRELKIEKAKEKTWSEILKEPPPEEIIEKIKIDFGLYESTVTWLVKNLFLFILRLFWFLRISGRENLPKQGPYLICPNHASYLDGSFIFSSIPFKNSLNAYFLGYQRIFEHPALYWANKVCRFISIDVSSHLAEAMQAVSYVLAKRKIVCIFPEGMRSIDSEVKEFKKGVGILIKELDIPVLPVYIQGSHQSWPRGIRLPRFYPIKVIFGRPFNFAELKEEGMGLGAKDDYEAVALGLRQEVIRLSFPHNSYIY